ncbi:MAG: hypothetical protein IJF18_05050 [Oscillospiraceae bacterium]|nr:hypothetical protein [Oscillospiraceae bacterium]
MGNEINTKPPNVVGFVNGATYEVLFNEYIYNDCRDGNELEKIVKNLLKPEKYDSSGSWCGISGFYYTTSRYNITSHLFSGFSTKDNPLFCYMCLK